MAFTVSHSQLVGWNLHSQLEQIDSSWWLKDCLMVGNRQEGLNRGNLLIWKSSVSLWSFRILCIFTERDSRLVSEALRVFLQISWTLMLIFSSLPDFLFGLNWRRMLNYACCANSLCKMILFDLVFQTQRNRAGVETLLIGFGWDTFSECLTCDPSFLVLQAARSHSRKTWLSFISVWSGLQLWCVRPTMRVELLHNHRCYWSKYSSY